MPRSGSLLVFFILILTIPSVAGAASMTMIQSGISGAVTTKNIIVGQIGAENDVIVGTSTGLYILTSDGGLEEYIQTPAPVSNVVVIDDATGDGINEIVIGTEDVYFPNVQCYDTATGEKLWEFSPKIEVYDTYILWTMKQTRVFDMIVLDDIDGDGYMDVAFSSGYVLYALSGKTGEKLWEFSDTDNVWDIQLTENGDILAGDQNGHVYFISSDSGEVIWKRGIAEGYTVLNPGTNAEAGDVKRSVWDIIPVDIDGKEHAAVSTEDGHVYLLDTANGETVWKLEIIDYVDTLLYSYYGDNPTATSSSDYNFFNLRLTASDSGLVAYTFPGIRYGKEYKGVKGIYMIDTGTGQIKWENENIDLTYAASVEVVDLGKEYLAVPLGKTGRKGKIRIMDPDDGSTYDTVNINSSSAKSRGCLFFIRAVGENRFLFTSSYDDLGLAEYPNGIVWRYPRINDVFVLKADFTGDGETDMLVKSRDGVDNENVFDEGKSRMFFVIDGATMETVWSYELPSKVFMETGGLSELQVAPDVNGDGKSDIVAYIQYDGDWNRGDEYGEKTMVMVFSGKTGKVLMDRPVTDADYYGIYERLFKDNNFFNETARKSLLDDWGISERGFDELTLLQKRDFEKQKEDRKSNILDMKDDVRIRKRIVSLDIIDDQSGDGIDDFIIGLWNDVFIMDSVSGDIVWNKTSRLDFYRDPFTGETPDGLFSNWTTDDRTRYIVVGNANNDGMDDLVLISWDNIMFLHSNVTGKNLEYAVAFTRSEKDGMDKERVTNIGDLNGNGADDIVFEKHVPDAPSMFIFADGRNGYTILESERNGVGADLKAADFNGNGFEDFIIFQMWTDGGGPSLQVTDGRTKEVIWNYNGIGEAWMVTDIFGYGTVMPAAPAGDINGDGITDIAVVRSQAWQPGAEVVIYDVKNNEELTTIKIEDTDKTRGGGDEWMPGISAEMLSDINGDGNNELGIIAAVGEEYQKQIRMFVIDVANSEILSDFSSAGKEMLNLGGGTVGMIGSSGNIYFLDTDKELKITSPSDGDVSGSPVRVTWTGASDSVTTVLVDSQKTLMTEEDSAEFEILSGEHKITVYSFDSYGKGVYDSIDVVIEKSSASTAVVTVIVMILIGLLFSPKLLTFVMGVRK